MKTWVLLSASVLIVAANTGTALFGNAGPFALMNDSATTALADLLPIVSGLLAVLCLRHPFNSLREWDSTKLCWGMLLGGIAFSTLGEIAFGAMEALLGLEMGDYSPADVFWIPGYGMLLVGMLIMLESYRKSGFDLGRKRFYLAILGIFCIIAAVVAAFLIIPIFSDTETSGLGKLVLSYYPGIDLLLIPVALSIAYTANLFGGAAVSRPWKLIAMGILLWSLSDISYAYMEWIDVYSSGSIIDLGWNLSYLFVGAGALQQQRLLASLTPGGQNAE